MLRHVGTERRGKTTTIEILEGLLEPTGGAVRILGMGWRDSGRAIRERISISLQNQVLRKTDRRETLTLFRSLYRSGIARPRRSPYLSRTRPTLGEEPLRRPETARWPWPRPWSAIRPRDELLDEPTTGLDPHSRRQLAEIIRQWRRHGRTTLLTTHYMEEAERLCDRVAIVDRGRIIALGQPRELIARLGGRHVVEFSVESPEAMRLPPETWSTLPAVTGCRCEDGLIHLSVTEPHVVLPALLEWLAARNWRLASLTTRHGSLDDVFVGLTGRQIEPAEEANR